MQVLNLAWEASADTCAAGGGDLEVLSELLMEMGAMSVVVRHVAPLPSCVRSAQLRAHRPRSTGTRRARAHTHTHTHPLSRSYGSFRPGRLKTQRAITCTGTGAQ